MAFVNTSYLSCVGTGTLLPHFWSAGGIVRMRYVCDCSVGISIKLFLLMFLDFQVSVLLFPVLEKTMVDYSNYNASQD